MEQTWIGEQSVIKAFNRTFVDCEYVRDAVVQLEWAYGKLKEPNVTYPNGKESHEVALETIDKHELDLIEYQLFPA